MENSKAKTTHVIFGRGLLRKKDKKISKKWKKMIIKKGFVLGVERITQDMY